jgi:hypothetical protein
VPATGVDPADQLADADAEREQVEHRLEEAADDDQPGVPERGGVALDHEARHPGAGRHRDGAREGPDAAQSTSRFV